MALTTYTAGEVLTAASLNANLTFAAANPAGQPMAVFNETQATNTAGGGSVANTFTKRVLNTTIVNDIGATLTSSVIALLPGTYFVQGSAPFVATQLTKLRLRNTTDGTDAITGSSISVDSNTQTSGGLALIMGSFTIAASKDFELQYFTVNNFATFGLGLAVNASGSSEVYAMLQIVKTA